MKIFHCTDSEAFSADVLGLTGATGLSIRFLITQADGAPNFAMMMLEVEPGGNTPNHNHGWEEEIFVKSGEGSVISDGKTTPVRSGEVIFIPADEPHQFVNNGNEQLHLICVIPNQSP
jgi:quercetin dioxygenase-like cupin family protein